MTNTEIYRSTSQTGTTSNTRLTPLLHPLDINKSVHVDFKSPFCLEFVFYCIGVPVSCCIAWNLLVGYRFNELCTHMPTSSSKLPWGFPYNLQWELPLNTPCITGTPPLGWGHWFCLPIDAIGVEFWIRNIGKWTLLTSIKFIRQKDYGWNYVWWIWLIWQFLLNII